MPRSTDHATGWNKTEGGVHERGLIGKGSVKWGSMSLFCFVYLLNLVFCCFFLIENGAWYKLKCQVEQVAGKPYVTVFLFCFVLFIYLFIF